MSLLGISWATDTFSLEGMFKVKDDLKATGLCLILHHKSPSIKIKTECKKEEYSLLLLFDLFYDLLFIDYYVSFELSEMSLKTSIDFSKNYSNSVK